MVVVAILGVLSGLGIMTWSKFLSRMRTTDQINELRDAIHQARSDAITRKRHSGILVDFTQRRYLLFVDSSATASSTNNGRYETGEKILRTWTSVSSEVAFYSPTSSIPPAPTIRTCGTSGSAGTSTTQTGAYSIVFRADGSACAPLFVKIGNADAPSDTFRLNVPLTGLLTMEK